jgi:hypothetical protein
MFSTSIFSFVQVCFLIVSEEFICKVASTVEEAKTLIEAGFSYVCEFQTVQEEKVKCRWLIPKQH